MKQNEQNSKNLINEIKEKANTNIKKKEKEEEIEKEINEKINEDQPKKKKHKRKKTKSLFPYQNNNIIIEEDEKTKIEKEIKKNEKILNKLEFGEFEVIQNLTKSIVNYRGDNTFIVFISINNILCLIYSNKREDKNNSIISYNIIDYKKICEIPNAHNEDITNFRHYFDKNNRKDLILSVSYKDNNIRLWNINDVQLLISINNINRHGFLKSACFLNFKNELFILSSNYSHSENADPIKVYDTFGNKVKEINSDNNHILFIDKYYDTNLSITYIITGHYGYVKSYDYNNNKKYHKYKENKKIDNYEHYSVIIKNNEDIIKLIETSRNSEIRIWDFHSKELLSKIQVSENENDSLYGISLFNNENLFVGCVNKIKFVDLENEEVINTLIDYNYKVITIKTINHPKYGNCLVSQDLYDGQIKLWVNKINKYKYLIDELYKKLQELEEN